jgi:hypothetical protein
LERIQYRYLRIAYVQTLEVFGGVPPLRLRFSMLNIKYLILAFSTGGHPLRRLLAMLSRLNSSKMVWEYDMSGDYDLEPLDYPLEALLQVVEWELVFVGRDFYQMVVTRLMASETSGFDS